MPGKILAAAPVEEYAGGVPSFPAVSGKPFTPIEVRMTGLTQISNEDKAAVKIAFIYDASDPEVVQTNQTPQGEAYSPGPGAMRLWTVDSDTARDPDSVEDGGHYVPADVWLTATNLFVNGQTNITLYIEGIDAASAADNGTIYAELWKDIGPLHGTNEAYSISGAWGFWDWITNQVRVSVLKVDIEADLKDQPPSGKTYASGINPNSIVLKLNGTQVTPTITDITDGKHVFYRPACSELNIPGNNTVELKVRDNANAGVQQGQNVNDAGNSTNPDPFTWSFTLP